MNIVLDTNVIVAGLRSRQGASFQILKRLPKGEIRFVLSVALFLEYEDVLKRKSFLADSGLSVRDVDAILSMLALKSIKTNVYYLWRPKLKDPNDDMVLETAVSGSAGAIVTFNGKDFSKGADQFGVEVIKPGEFLSRLLGGRDE